VQNNIGLSSFATRQQLSNVFYFYSLVLTVPRISGSRSCGRLSSAQASLQLCYEILNAFKRFILAMKRVLSISSPGWHGSSYETRAFDLLTRLARLNILAERLTTLDLRANTKTTKLFRCQPAGSISVMALGISQAMY
jgi:hypothetical protein